MRNSILILLALVGVACAAQTPTTSSFQKVNALCESKAGVLKCKKAKVTTESGKKMSPCAWTGKKKKKCTIKACDSFAKKPSCAAAPYCTWSGKKSGKCIENVDVESDTEDACEALKEELEEQKALVAEADAKTKAATLSAQEAKADADASRKYAEEMEAEVDKAKEEAAARSKYAKRMKAEADEAKAEAAASSKYAEEMKAEADKANAEADASRKYGEEMKAEADKANAEAEAANAELEIQRERAERGDAEIAYLKGRSNGLLKIPHWIAQSLNNDASMMTMNPDLLATGGDDAFLILAHVLMNGVPSLQRISMQNCNLDDTDAIALATALPSLPSLIEIDLVSNSIGDAGAVALSETLEHLPVLKGVYLKYNKFGDVGAQAFADAVADGKIPDTLKYIYLTIEMVNLLD